jgi:putative aldouronate transport system substrate-binding protein
MTPNAVSTSSGPRRRGFLASAAVATAAVAACGGSDTGSRAGEQVQSNSEFLIEAWTHPARLAP